MIQLDFSVFPVLETERLVLRAETEKDIPVLFKMRSDPEMRRYSDRDPVKTTDEIVDLMKLIRAGIEGNSAISWGITLKGSDEMIGNIAFWKIAKDHHRAELGYMLWKDFWKKGIMSEALEVVLDHGFSKMKLHSAEAQVNPNNAASIALLEKFGFVREAYFRENFHYNGKFLDSAVYSKLTPVSA